MIYKYRFISPINPIFSSLSPVKLNLTTVLLLYLRQSNLASLATTVNNTVVLYYEFLSRVRMRSYAAAIFFNTNVVRISAKSYPVLVKQIITTLSPSGSPVIAVFSELNIVTKF